MFINKTILSYMKYFFYFYDRCVIKFWQRFTQWNYYEKLSSCYCNNPKKYMLEIQILNKFLKFSNFELSDM